MGGPFGGNGPLDNIMGNNGPMGGRGRSLDGGMFGGNRRNGFGSRGQRRSNSLNRTFKKFGGGARSGQAISSNILDQVAEQGAKKGIIKQIRKLAFKNGDGGFGGRNNRRGGFGDDNEGWG